MQSLPEDELIALWVMQGGHTHDAVQPVLAVDTTIHKGRLNQTLTWLLTRDRLWYVRSHRVALQTLRFGQEIYL